MQTSSLLELSSLNNQFGQVNRKNLQQINTGFLDNFWYNAPFLNGQQIQTYSLNSVGTEFSALDNEGNL